MGFFRAIWEGTKKAVKGAVNTFNDICDYVKHDDGLVASTIRIATEIVSFPGNAVSSIVKSGIENTAMICCMACGDSLIEASLRVKHFEDKIDDTYNKIMAPVSEWIDDHTFDGVSEAIGNAVSICTTVTGVKAGYKMTQSSYKNKYKANLMDDFEYKKTKASKVNNQYNDKIASNQKDIDKFRKKGRRKDLNKARRKELKNDDFRQRRDNEIRSIYKEKIRKSKWRVLIDAIIDDVKNAFKNYKFSLKEKLKGFGRKCLEHLGNKNPPKYLKPYDGTHICPCGCNRSIPDGYKNCLEIFRVDPYYFFCRGFKY